MTCSMTMEKIRSFKLEFVHYIPKELNQGVLYISMEYSLVVHLCACGCGEKVATPLSPEDWKLYYDGEAITLSPSIGNWDFSCMSHYWIRRSKVIFVEKINDEYKGNKQGKQKEYCNSIFFTLKRLKSPSKKKNAKKKKG